MNKIGLIIAREYLSRIRKKSFIIMTILGPILFSCVFIIPIWLVTIEEGEEKIIQVIDIADVFRGEIKGSEIITYDFVDSNLESAKKALLGNEIFGVLYIPKIDFENPKGIRFISMQNCGMNVISMLEEKIAKEIERIKLVDSNLDEKVLNNLKTDISLQTIRLSELGVEKENSTGAAVAIGYATGFLIYMFVFIYGAQIMRGIVEEKTSRVIEVVISSVRPFQLMMGKIIGIASVGLTQFVLWVFLSWGFILGFSFIIMKDVDSKKTEGVMEQSMIMASSESARNQEIYLNSLNALKQINLPLILTCFVFYFLAGYFLYGALFAAIGSAVDSEADTQQFIIPIAAPLIISLLLISVVMQEPNGNLAFWFSIIPLTSPVIMMSRLAFDVPTSEILLSMILLVGCFCITTWIASRIYRVGIFMHGVKINYKILVKWVMKHN
ncbi:MAG: ABC transporter permease [Reichenbachiella sp.]